MNDTAQTIDPTQALRLKLVFALYDKALEHLYEMGGTPYIIVDCSVTGVEVPVFAIKDNMITLNLSASAIRDYYGSAESGISFSARFGGKAHAIRVPLTAIRLLYDKNTGLGIYPNNLLMAASTETVNAIKQAAVEPAKTSAEAPKPEVGKPSFLKVVK